MERSDVPEVDSRLAKVKRDHKVFAEAKWTKISKNKLPFYQEFVHKFFEISESDMVHFHSLLIDTTKLDHHAHNSGNKEIGFSKFIYQLLLKFGRLYVNERKTIHAYLDQRVTKQSLDELRTILNYGIAKKYGQKHDPYRRVQFLDSADSCVLQLNDVLLGALASRANGHHERDGASQPRCTISELVLELAQIRDVHASTPIGVNRFTTWNLRLK